MNNKTKVIQNDTIINDLAIYSITNGLMKVAKDPAILHRRFAEYKHLIKRGEFTLAELENDILNEYGITDNKESDPYSLKAILKGSNNGK